MKDTDLQCKYCGKQCKNKNSLRQHEIRCPHNPDKITTTVLGFNNVGRRAWNKDLKLEDSASMQKQHDSYMLNERSGLHTKHGHPHTQETKSLLRGYALEKGFGGFHMRKGKYYNNIKLDSSYEVRLAKDLDANNIRWIRPKRLPYYIDDKLHHYTPDFYLPDYNVYLDPKNDYLIERIAPGLGITDVDKIRLVSEQNDVTIHILREHQLCWNEVEKLLL